MKIYDLEDGSYILQIAREIIEAGGIIAFPTDTIYGLCASFTKEGVKKLHKVRERAFDKPFLLTLPEDYSLSNLVEKVSPNQEKMIQRCWPGRITILFVKKKGLFYPLSKNIALRKPSRNDCVYFHQLLVNLRFPLLSTSINLPGKKNLVEPDEINKSFLGAIDAYFKLSNKLDNDILKPSQIWDITNEKQYHRIR